MSYLGREFLHPTLETIWGAILLSCYMRSHNPTCSKGSYTDAALAAIITATLVISHWWLNGLNEHDGPGIVPVVMLRHRLAALIKSDSSNTQNQCPGAPYPVAQQIVTAELPASFHTAEPIGSMPTEQVSPRQSHEFGGTAEMDEPSASAPSGMHGIENLVIPRSSSPPAFVHGGLSTLAHALAAASAGPFHLTQPNNSMTTPNTVVPGQVFPLQHFNAVHSNVVNASTVYGPPATEYGTTAQPPRRYSYAEIARRGLNLA
ncbi:uncharacterized protein EI90DRAFT_3064319 [Cantharellus anzutake]|uniref:uncharacterized protein n=1 Tax=Cantharellus anzutake TaxID=1750568 RepID=UPI001903B64A|nr:uncharacterized protein EI90DRAFT_3064319 [Cantharellus anzutake]KAF8328704.1 hypothetical protein EI90DRAFT_3064319 [Cantharellus anzutake]